MAAWPWRTKAERDAEDRLRAWSVAHTDMVLLHIRACQERLDGMIKRNKDMLADLQRRVTFP